MNVPDAARPERRCGNEGCARPAEPGEAYCDACSLDRLLFDREERHRQVEASPRRSLEERRT